MSNKSEETKTTPSGEGLGDVRCYAVFSGHIRAQDGDRHFISHTQLINLYKVNPAKCFNGHDQSKWDGRRNQKIVSLRPKGNGNYNLA